MPAVDRDRQDYLYRQVVELIGSRIDAGELTPGDRLPSLRRMSDRLGVSLPTVRQAYIELERQGRVHARPQSGFYVQARAANRLQRTRCGQAGPVTVCCMPLAEQVYAANHRPDMVPLGIANPSMALPAARVLHRTMRRIMSRCETQSLSYAPIDGDPGLKRQLAFRMLQQGGDVRPEDIIITNGAQEALALALRSACKPGDVVAVESPTYHGLLELIESEGMLALEIETCPEAGVRLDALAEALDRHSIAACMFSSALNNPLGSTTSDEHRRELVALLESRDVILIEDDVYGELLFDGSRPRLAQFYSRKGLVLSAGSFSKTAAPGYRIGWLLAGRLATVARRYKRSLSCSSGLLQQLTLAELMASGDYERHLRRLRPVLKANAERMTGLICRHFPAETRVSRPAGGSVLWVELPPEVDAEQLFLAAVAEQVSIAPGVMFGPGDRYRHHIRLSFGHPWSERIAAAIRRLGQLVQQQRPGTKVDLIRCRDLV